MERSRYLQGLIGLSKSARDIEVHDELYKLRPEDGYSIGSLLLHCEVILSQAQMVKLANVVSAYFRQVKSMETVSGNCLSLGIQRIYIELEDMIGKSALR